MEWTGPVKYNKKQLVLLAIDKMWNETRLDRARRLSPPRQSGYIEIRLRPDQLNLQEEINQKCKGIWFPTPRDPDDKNVIGVSAETDTSILDAMGVQYSFK